MGNTSLIVAEIRKAYISIFILLSYVVAKSSLYFYDRILRCVQYRRVERGGHVGRQRRRAGRARGQGQRVRVAPGAVPGARARPARAPRHQRAQILQHPPTHGKRIQHPRPTDIRMRKLVSPQVILVVTLCNIKYFILAAGKNLLIV